MHAQVLRFFMNIWPPFLGAGIKIITLSKDYRYTLVRLRMGIFNRNIAGVHFGGSLFAMTDPFFMIMVQHNLGKEYVVWDRAAKIDFVKPGRGNVHAEFSISEQQLEDLKSAAQNGAKVLRDFTVEVKDGSGEIVAIIIKTLYVRQKRKI